MILIEFTFSSTIHRISDEMIALDHFWDSKVASNSSIKYSLKSIGGGMIEPSFGNISILPSLFDAETEYPISCPIKIMHTDTDEASATTVLEGTAHLKTIKEDSVDYELFPPEFDTKVDDITYNDTLINVFSAACTTLGVTLDSTNARAVSPAVNYKATGEKVLVDNLSNMARFFSHMFYIEDGILYLIDMLTETAVVDITEFNILPSGYTYNKPVSIFKTGSDTTEASVDGTYSYGDEDSISPQCHTTIANSETALTDRKTIIESPQIRLAFPLDIVYKPGVKLVLKDESQEITLNSEAKVRSVSWDFDSYECVVEGEGVFI